MKLKLHENHVLSIILLPFNLLKTILLMNLKVALDLSMYLVISH